MPHAPPRSAQECKIQWIGTEQPGISKTGWTEAEDAIIKAHVSPKLSAPADEREPIDWKLVCDDLLLGSRTRIQCLRRHHEIAELATKIPWTVDEDHELLEAVKEFGTSNWVIGELVFIDKTYIPTLTSPSGCLPPLRPKPRSMCYSLQIFFGP